MAKHEAHEHADPSVDGGDEALKVLGSQVEQVSDKESAKVLRKIDWRLVPVLMFVNALQLIDKNVSCTVDKVAKGSIG